MWGNRRKSTVAENKTQTERKTGEAGNLRV